jgi:hypothetical protein
MASCTVEFGGLNNSKESRMHSKAGKLFGVAILILASGFLCAQDSTAMLTGTLADSSGQALADAVISVKNATTGEATQAKTDSSGHFTISNLAAGDYEVTASGAGGAASAKISLTAGAQQSLSLTLTQSQGQPPPASTAPASSENLPNAPSSSKTEPSLEDLGFSKSEQQGNAQQQALLDKRTHMLKIHQRLGLIAAVPIVASVVTSLGAGGRDTSKASRDLHMALGAAAGDLYFTSAYFAIRAPKVAGTETRGPIRLHKALAWIHGPGMILTPILGAIAFDQKSKGEKVHGIAAAHGPVAIVTAGAFGAALLSVSVKF